MMMSGAWLREDNSATYEKLARVLIAVGKKNIARAMCTVRAFFWCVLTWQLTEGLLIKYALFMNVAW